MIEQQWQARLDATHASSLPLIINGILGVQVLAVLRDLIIMGTDLPNTLILVNILSIAMMVAMVIWVRTQDILDRHSHRIVAIAFASVSAKALASSIAQVDALPFYMAIIMLAGSLVFLSRRYLLVFAVVFCIAWAFLTSPVLPTAVLTPTFIVILIGALLGSYILHRRILALVEVYKLEQRVETLESILPMCAGCKKTRDHLGAWRSIEQYIEDQQSGLQVSHGVCPDCSKELYSDFHKAKQEKNENSESK